MKYIKSFENLQTDAQVGEYCIANSKSIGISIQNFFLNNIGKIRRIESSIAGNDIDNEFEVEIYDDSGVFVVDYENKIPWNNKYHNYSKSHNHTYLFYGDEILFHAKTKEELELQMTAKKYNL